MKEEVAAVAHERTQINKELKRKPSADERAALKSEKVDLDDQIVALRAWRDECESTLKKKNDELSIAKAKETEIRKKRTRREKPLRAKVEELFAEHNVRVSSFHVTCMVG